MALTVRRENETYRKKAVRCDGGRGKGFAGGLTEYEGAATRQFAVCTRRDDRQSRRL